MKILFVFALLIPMVTSAETVGPNNGFAWDYDPANLQLIDGFRLYANGTKVWEGAAQTATISAFDAPLADGVYDFHATAFNAVGESGPSNPVSAAVVSGAPAAPINLTINIQVTIQ